MANRSSIWPITVVLTLLICFSAGSALATPTAVSVDDMTLTIDVVAGRPLSDGGAGYLSLPYFTVQADFEGSLLVDWDAGTVTGIALTEVAGTRSFIGDYSEPLQLGGDLITVGNGLTTSTVTTASLPGGGYSAAFDLSLQINLPIEGMVPLIWPLVNKESVGLAAQYGSDPSDNFQFLNTSMGPVALWHRQLLTLNPLAKLTVENGSEPVPEPSTLLLLGLGLLGTAGYRRKRKGG
jgi:hypothetical protein